MLDRWKPSANTDRVTIPPAANPSPSVAPADRSTVMTALTGRRLVLLTVLLGGFTAFGPLSMDLYLPAFPQLANELGASQSAVQLTHIHLIPR